MLSICGALHLRFIICSTHLKFCFEAMEESGSLGLEEILKEKKKLF